MKGTATKERKTISFGKNVDVLSGKILPNMAKFTLPIILTGFLQQFYNAADTIVVVMTKKYLKGEKLLV